MLLALAISGCGPGTDGSPEGGVSRPPCTSAAVADKRAFDDAAMLAEHPAEAEQHAEVSDCDDVGEAFAYRLYRTDLGAETVAAFYRGIAQRRGWVIYRTEVKLDPAHPALEGEDFLCAKGPVGSGDAYLELWWPSESGVLEGGPEEPVYGLMLGRSPRQQSACRTPLPS